MGYTRIYRKDWQSASSNTFFNGVTYQSKWQGNYNLTNFYKMIFGFDYLREQGESTYDAKRMTHTKGYYLENILNPLENLFISAAYRFEDHSRFHNHGLFNVSLSYYIAKTKTKIKGSFGEGFHAPSLFQLFSPTYGNLNLNPEESESYETGFEQTLWRDISFGSTYFHTHLSNLIDFVNNKYTNGGKIRIYGVENFFKYLVSDNTSLTISYTHMDTKKLVDGTRLTRRPNNKVTCEFKTTLLEWLNIHYDISYIGNRTDGSNKLKSYILTNIALNYMLNDKIDVFLRFENIMDRDYELVKGYQTPKFSWYLGAKFTF
jgi:vitamin B12 transporter